MKKNIFKLMIISIILISLTGCTKILKDENNKAVVYNKTGQSLTKNIFCQPTNKEVIEKYKINKINVEDLPKCNEFKITDGGYEGLWTTFFVKPLAYIILKIGKLVNSYGLAVILAGLLIRLLTMPITKKTALQSENMKKAQPELVKIEKKYQDKKDQASIMQKSQETMIIYKKYGINPVFGCLFAMLQLPLFFAFLEAVNRVPAIFEENFLTFQLGTNPLVGMSKGNPLYFLLIIAIILTTYYTFKLSSSTTTNPEQEKQMKLMMKIMIVFITMASFTLPAAIALYWITSSLFTIIQNILIKRSKGNVKNI
jgi:YidC/Oxa1 family membrane protein insertase